jgi:hypothetical protein
MPKEHTVRECAGDAAVDEGANVGQRRAVLAVVRVLRQECRLSRPEQADERLGQSAPAGAADATADTDDQRFTRDGYGSAHPATVRAA